MSSCKRQRLDSLTTITDAARVHTHNAFSSLAPAEPQLLTTSGASFFLNGLNGATLTDSLATNIYLTICDENSNASTEYYTIDSNTISAHIKLEKEANGEISSALQPPCEIYLFRQFPDTATPTTKEVASAICTNLFQHQQSTIVSPVEKKPLLNPNCNEPPALLIDTNTKTKNSQTVSGEARTDMAAGIGIEINPTNREDIENYKKRDDKRRATHNEIERRRRDKINYWIFKLKDMLPKDEHELNLQLTQCGSNAGTNSMQTVTSSYNSMSTNGRTPPNDSKSQILIRACDYIKTMQTELVGLRNCVNEVEELRSMNQQLENELGNLRQKIFRERPSSCINNSSFVTLNALNSSSDPLGGIETTSATVQFTKSGLKITDFVD